MNEFYVYGDTLIPNTVARSSDVKAEYQGVEAGFDKLPTEAQLKFGTANYGTESGAANAYVVTMPYTPAQYYTGMVVSFKAVNANTGGSTVNVDSLGVKSIKRPDGTALSAGDIGTTGATVLVYNGTDFVIVNSLPSIVTQAAAQVALAADQVTLANTARTGAETAQGLAETAQAAAELALDSFDDRYLGSKTSDPVLDNDGNPLQTGALYWLSTDGKMRVYDGAAWQDVGKSTATTYEYTATASQTTFSGLDINGKTLSYTTGYTVVWLNGVRLDEADFTATDGSSVVLGAGAAAGDTVAILAYGSFDIANHYTKAEIDANYYTQTQIDTNIYTKTQSDAAFAEKVRPRQNLIINGNFAIWQRGIPATLTAGVSTYCADRWIGYFAGATGSARRPARSDGTGYAMVADGVAGNTTWNIQGRIEGSMTREAKNQNITISGTIHSGDARSVTLRLEYANSPDVFSARTLIATTSVSVTSGENDFAWTVNAGANAGNGLAISVEFGAITSGTDYGISRMKMEIGDYATPFVVEVIGDEIVRCLRYYQRSQSYDRTLWFGDTTASMNYYANVKFSTPMRTTPTVTLTNSIAVNFGATPGTPAVDPAGFQEGRTATATASGSNFGSTWKADAEL